MDNLWRPCAPVGVHFLLTTMITIKSNNTNNVVIINSNWRQAVWPGAPFVSCFFVKQISSSSDLSMIVSPPASCVAPVVVGAAVLLVVHPVEVALLVM